MSAGQRTPGVPAEELRRRFDATFVAAPVDRDEGLESFLTLKIGDEGYALRVRDVTGFAAARRIVPLPSPIAEMLGLAGIRGSVVPVFSLAAMIGYEQAQEVPRWFLLCRAAEPIALGFREFEGYLELPRAGRREVADVGESDPPRAQRDHVRHVVRARGEARGVIDVPSVVQAIEAKVAAAAAVKER